MKRRLLRGILLGLSLLATMKICILGLGIDEEYAVTMACRMITEDRMFLEMWEPHQTSGFLTACLAAVFVRVTGSYDYLILFLRLAGAGIQAGISLFLYRTLRKEFSEEAAFFVAVFFYNTLPKWIQTTGVRQQNTHLSHIFQSPLDIVMLLSGDNGDYTPG